MAVNFNFTQIYSNDGETLLFSIQPSGDSTATVTSTGVEIAKTDGSYTYTPYTYEGDKIFAGLATEANATEAVYKVGDTFTIPSPGNIKLYIVEGTSSGGESGGATITYNGKEIATITDGQTATIPCEDRKMVGDIVITYAMESGGGEDGGEDSGFDANELIGTWLLNEDIEYYSLSGANFHKDVTINVSGTFYGWKRYSTISERSNTDLTRIVFNGAYDGTNGSENYPRGRLTFYNDNQKYTNSAGSTYTQCTRWLRGGALVDYVTECHMWAVNAEDKKYYFEVVSDSYYKRSARHLTISSIGDNSTEDLRMVLAWLKANAVKQGDETGGSSN
jgi:hypothetical protein